MTPANGHKNKRETWQRFLRAVRNFRASDAGRKALRLFVMLMVILLGINGLNVLNSYVGRDFISAIENKDLRGFVGQAWLYIGVFGLSTLAAVMARYAEERVGLLWREWQTRQMIDSYLNERAYYQLEESGELQNPDQRIAEDIHTFTTTTLSFAIMMLNAAITFVAFSGVLWSISPRLFVVAVIYAGVGTLLTVWLGKTLVSLNDHQLDKEANFRAELMHVRDNAEALALLNREDSLRERLVNRLNDLVGNARRMISVNRNLGFFTTGYNYMIQIMPALVVAPLFIDGRVEFGVITQSAMAFAQLMGAFSLIVTQFQSISSYAAVIARLGRLNEAMDHLCTVSTSPIHLEFKPGAVVFDHLNLKDPDGDVLIADLSATIPSGTRVLIRGTSGHAKAALFKATAGLDCDGDGHIVRPGPQEMQFLPERPYLPKGSLRAVLTLGIEGRKVTDEAIHQAITALDLDSVAQQAGGLDVEQDWGALTSLGEQAMMGMARVLLAAPAFVFADRLSVALDARQSAQVLRALTEHHITYLVMGKPEERLTHFDAALDIERNGTWKWRTAAQLHQEAADRESG